MVLLGFLAVRVLFHRLGGDAFGIILFAQAASLTLTGLLDLGLSATTVREVATWAADDRPYITSLLRTAGLLYWSSYLLLASAFLLLAPLVATKWINLAQLDARQATQLLEALGIGGLLALPRSLYASLLRGLQRMGLVNAIEVGTIAAQQLGWLVMLQAGTNLIGVGVWFSLVQALGTIAYFVAVARWFSARALLPGYFPDTVHRNRLFASQAMFSSILGTLHGQSDKLLVSKLLPIALLGTYGFTWTVVAAVSRVSSALAQAAYPAFAGMLKTSAQSALLHEYRRVQNLVLVLSGPCFAALVFGCGPLFTLVFGTSVSRELALPTFFLCLAFYMNGSVITPYMVSLAAGRPDIAARQNLLAVFFVLPVALLAVLRFGLAGAAFSWLVYQCFAYMYGVPRICRACLRISTYAWFAQLAAPTLILVVTYLPAYLIASGPGQSRPQWLALTFTASTVIYGLYARRAFNSSSRQTRPATFREAA
jgi:O-antigen/teichoic acid export membrane protein